MPLRTPHSALRIRRGHTLVELLVAAVSGSMLLAALASTMYIARQVAYSPVHAQTVLEGTNLAFDLMDELKHAIYIVDRGATHIEFVTDDRNGDNVEDTFRYAWSGTAGDPLTKAFNRGTPVNVVEEVHQFQLDYTIEEASEDLEVLTLSNELQLTPQYAGDGSSYDLLPDNYLAQMVDLSSLPASAKSWSLTRIRFEASQSSGADGQFAVQLRQAASDGTPTSEVLAEYIVDESALSSSGGWYTITPSTPLSGLSPHKDYCIAFVWQSGGAAARISLADSPSAAVQTSDSGATWATTGKWAQLIVFGRPALPDTPITIREDRLRSVGISLQGGESSLTRIDTAVVLDNRPLLVEKAWRADFDRDPTIQDRNGDGTGDFMSSGGTFNMATVIDGVWQASGYLEAENTSDITTPVLIDVRGRNTDIGGNGLTARALVRLGASEHVDLTASIALQADGTQTVQLLADDGTKTHVLTSVGELSAEPLDVRLLIEPVRRLAALRVKEVDYPVAAIPVINSGLTADSFSITEDTSDAEYDYASFQITMP